MFDVWAGTLAGWVWPPVSVGPGGEWPRRLGPPSGPAGQSGCGLAGK